jgi:hypothetical protein
MMGAPIYYGLLFVLLKVIDKNIVYSFELHKLTLVILINSWRTKRKNHILWYRIFTFGFAFNEVSESKCQARSG